MSRVSAAASRQPAALRRLRIASTRRRRLDLVGTLWRHGDRSNAQSRVARYGVQPAVHGPQGAACQPGRSEQMRAGRPTPWDPAEPGLGSFQSRQPAGGFGCDQSFQAGMNPDLLTYPVREMSGFRWQKMDLPGKRSRVAGRGRPVRSAAADGWRSALGDGSPGRRWLSR